MENNEIALPDTQSTYNNLKPILENQGYKLEKMENTFKQGGTIVHNQGSAGGVLVGKRHSEGGIKAINKSNGEPLEMEGGEVVITRNAVSDTETVHEFDGKKMTKKEILSEINVQGGGIAFANGGEVPTHINVTGKRFNYGGKLTPDYEIVKDCGCQHSNAGNRKKLTLPTSNTTVFKKFADGGTINNESFFLGVQTEKKEHGKTLHKLREGKITEEEALREIAAKHLKDNPEYYQHEKYEKGGPVNNDTQRTQLINEARLHCNEVNGIYKNIFEQETEQCLYECAVQCNSSESEKLGAKKVFGKRICEIAVQLYPNASIEQQLMLPYHEFVKKYPLYGYKNNKNEQEFQLSVNGKTGYKTYYSSQNNASAAYKEIYEQYVKDCNNNQFKNGGEITTDFLVAEKLPEKYRINQKEVYEKLEQLKKQGLQAYEKNKKIKVGKDYGVRDEYYAASNFFNKPENAALKEKWDYRVIKSTDFEENNYNTYRVADYCNYRDVYKKITFDNYYIGTKAVFKRLPILGYEEKQTAWKNLQEQYNNITQSPKSSSQYIQTDKGIYRYSDHWGRVASCDWDLLNEESGNYTDGLAIGYCDLADFSLQEYTYSGYRTICPDYFKLTVENNIREIKNHILYLENIRTKKSLRDKWLYKINTLINSTETTIKNYEAYAESFHIENYAKGGTIKDKVIANSDLLKNMKTHTELRKWAIENEMDNRSAFPKFKTALNEIGVDYDEIKTGINTQQKNELLNKIEYTTTLYVDAKASAGKFGITDENGEILWYGRFFDDDNAGEQSRAELAAAKKAVWLASKIKESVGANSIELILYVDAQWLTYQDHSGQKGYALTQLAKKYDIDLHVQWISGKDNPADEWTTASGYKKWSDNDLSLLAIKKSSELSDDLEVESKSHLISETLLEQQVSNNPFTNKISLQEFTKLVNNFENFVPALQRKYLLDVFKGEEKQLAIDIARRLYDIFNRMPKTYETENTPKERKVLWLHYFYSGSDWYIMEKDMYSDQYQAFGYAILNGDTENAEMGYISIPELMSIRGVELDFYFTPITFGELFKEETELQLTDQQEKLLYEAQLTDSYVELQKSNFEANFKLLEAAGIVYTTPSLNRQNVDVYLTDKGKDFVANYTFKKENKVALPQPVVIEQKNYTYFKGTQHSYENPFTLNKAIEELIDELTPQSITPEQKTFISYYSGYGGLEKFGATGKGLLYEYFTPTDIVKKMWGLAYKHGYKGGPLLEPSVGVGEFIKFSPAQEIVTAYEINPYSAKICRLLFPNITLIEQPFETMFIKNRESIKNKVMSLKKFNLVIGNPPYGDFQGIYAGMGEKAFTHAENYIDYFISRGLDALNKNGLLIFIIGTEVAAGGKPFLQKPMTKAKAEIAKKSVLLDAYRLPNGVFERTDVLSDIIVLQKL